MTTTTFNKTENVTLLTCQNVGSTGAAAGAGIVLGTGLDVSAKMNAMLNVYHVRTSSGSNTGQTLYRLEHSPNGATGPWVPVVTWTSGFGNSIANMQTLNSNAAAAATTIQLSAALGSALSNPIGIYNAATPALSEINYQQMASTNPTLNWSLTGAQTAGVAIATSYAEMWSIPLDLSAVTMIRLTVDNVANAVTQPVNVKADLVFADSLNTA